MRNDRLLAIDPGTREMGVAVLEAGRLRYSGTEVFKKLRSPQAQLKQCRAAVLRLIRDFRPAAVAIEKTFIGRNRSAALLNVLTDEIVALARRHRLRVLSLSPSQVKKAVAGDGWAGKDEVAAAVAARLPELRVYLAPERAWKKSRQLNMFDAVAVGLACLDDDLRSRASDP